MNNFQTCRYSWNSSISLPFLHNWRIELAHWNSPVFYQVFFRVISWHVSTHFSKLEAVLHLVEKIFELFINSVKSYREGFSGQPVCLTFKSEISVCNTVDTVILAHQRIKANQNTIGRWPNERYPRKQCFKCSH